MILVSGKRTREETRTDDRAVSQLSCPICWTRSRPGDRQSPNIDTHGPSHREAVEALQRRRHPHIHLPHSAAPL